MIRQINVITGVETQRSMNDEEQAQVKIAELEQLALAPTQYQRDRQPAYPDIGDQLDDLYHAGMFSAEMAAKIKLVKDKFPKE